MKLFQRLQQLLSQILGFICVIVFGLLVLDVMWGVFARQVLNAQPAWTEQLARMLLVWLSILGGVLAYAGDAHLGVDVLVTNFHSTTQRWARIVGHVSVFLFSVCVLLIGGGLLFQDRLASGQQMATLGIPRAWFYFVLPVGGFLIAFVSIEKILNLLAPATETEGQA